MPLVKFRQLGRDPPSPECRLQTRCWRRPPFSLGVLRRAPGRKEQKRALPRRGRPERPAEDDPAARHLVHAGRRAAHALPNCQQHPQRQGTRPRSRSPAPSSAVLVALSGSSFPSDPHWRLVASLLSPPVAPGESIPRTLHTNTAPVFLRFSSLTRASDSAWLQAEQTNAVCLHLSCAAAPTLTCLKNSGFSFSSCLSPLERLR